MTYGTVSVGLSGEIKLADGVTQVAPPPPPAPARMHTLYIKPTAAMSCWHTVERKQYDTMRNKEDPFELKNSANCNRLCQCFGTCVKITLQLLLVIAV